MVGKEKRKSCEVFSFVCRERKKTGREQEVEEGGEDKVIKGGRVSVCVGREGEREVKEGR